MINTVNAKYVPLPPTLLPADVSKPGMMTIKWKPPTNTNIMVRGYNLLVYNVDLKRHFVIRSLPGINVNEFVLNTGIAPSTNYKIEMSSYNPSGQSVTVRKLVTTPAGPAVIPDFTAVNHPDAPDVIQLNWNYPQFVAGDIKSFIIHYKLSHDNKWTSITVPKGVFGYNITGFVQGKDYDTYVVGIYGSGATKETKRITVKTLNENNPPSIPLQMYVRPSADSLAIGWLPPIGNVITRGYNVLVQDESGKDVARKLLLGQSNTFLKVYNDIVPSTKYNVLVDAYNLIGKSLRASQTVMTLAAPKPAILVTGVSTDKRSIQFDWTDSLAVAGVAMKYIIKYDVFDENLVKKEMTASTTTPSIIIDKLTPYTNYKFLLKRESDTQYPSLVTLDSRTKEAAPSAPVDVTSHVMDDYNTWMILSWQIPKFPNGKIKEYVIRYTENANSAAAMSTWKETNTQSVSMTHNVTGLAAGTKYVYVVAGVNGAGIGAFSKMAVGSTSGPVAVPVAGGAVIPVPMHGHGGLAAAGFDWWWIVLIILLLLLLLLLLLCCCYCCCCPNTPREKWFARCPCCERCRTCCCLPFLRCCSCCACANQAVVVGKTGETIHLVDGGGTIKKTPDGMVDEEFMFAADTGTLESTPLTGGDANFQSGNGVGMHVEVDGSAAGAAAGGGSAYAGSLAAGAGGGTALAGGAAGAGGAGLAAAGAGIKVPIPGNTTFISFKTSLQDYCTKVGWMPPVYNTSGDGSLGYSSKVSFGGNTFGGEDIMAISKQESEQMSAYNALVGLGVIRHDMPYNAESSINIPGPTCASFISYKCSLADFCQQCNILPPRYTTTKHSNGYSSMVQIGNHTFNMPGRVENGLQVEQKTAFTALTGLCMLDSQAGYHPECCFTVPAPGDDNFVSYKSSLHDFCQRYKLPPPQYITSQGSNGYSAKLKFGGLFFQSSENFSSRLVAEQQAAFEALLGLGLLPSTLDFSETDVPPSQNVSVSYSRGSSTGGSRSESKPPSKPGSRSDSRHGSISNEATIRANVSGDTYATMPRVGFTGGGSTGNKNQSSSVSYAYTGYNEGSGTNLNAVAPVVKKENTLGNIKISISTTGGGDNPSQQFSSSSQQYASSAFSTSSSTSSSYSTSYVQKSTSSRVVQTSSSRSVTNQNVASVQPASLELNLN